MSPWRAACLAQGEQLIQDLRRRLLAALLAAPEDGLDLRAELARALDTMNIPPEEED
jgi:hypothetical protein